MLQLPTVPQEIADKVYSVCKQITWLKTPVCRFDMVRDGIFEVETQPSVVYPAWFLQESVATLFVNAVASVASVALRIIDTDIERSRYDQGCKRLGWQHASVDDQASTSAHAYLSGADANIFKQATSLGWNVVTQLMPKDDKRMLAITRAHVCTSLDKVLELLASDDFEQGAVAKPAQGMCCRDISFLANKKPFKKRGATKSRFLRDVEMLIKKYGKVVIQPFYAPELSSVNGKDYYGIWRIYAVRQSSSLPFEPVLAFYNARPSTLKIHGAGDAYFEAQIVG